MKILRLAVAVLATSSVVATARNSDHSVLLLGPSQLTCGKFNKLAKVEKDKVMAWALGYVSGMATSEAEEVRMERQSSKEERADVKPIDERKLVAQIRQQCLLRPNVFFPLIVEWAAVECDLTGLICRVLDAILANLRFAQASRQDVLWMRRCDD